MLPLTSEQQMMVDACRRMVTGDILPVLNAHPMDRPLPRTAAQQILRLLATMGLTAARLPVEAGGTGMSALEYGLMVEQLPASVLFLLLPQESTIARLNRGCSKVIRHELLPALIQADLLTCTAATEPDTGSDPRGIRTRLRRTPDGLRLSGTKMWISNATIADVVNVTCIDDDGRMARVLVDCRRVAVDAREIPVTGLQQCHLGEIVFNDCLIDPDHVLDTSGDSAKVLTLTWLANRPLIGLSAVHLAQRAFELTRAYVLDRKQFGRPLGGFQLVQERLADIETAIVTSRLLCYHALAAIDRGERANGPSAMAKRYAVAACQHAIQLAMQLHGSMGLSQEVGLERMARDVAMLAIPDGTPEILTLIQGREITGFDAFRA